MTQPDTSFFDAVENLRQELYLIKQQLHFFAGLTIHEHAQPLTIDPETFSVTMSRLAEQVEAAIINTEALKAYKDS
ncbi:hypothetical protein NB640_01490 [Oxalobacter vibrioformis]|uniref:Uncharacterized protein n=1 Tax=Oxalobacter vibrioformis TaxID=933080 RepID=A0A9E9LX77_9BURK|nr:hypothetical protein [Oxalobacter vibrioformis]WAW10367.1 hypothetical protein NB640_01490 [Oxalobacter vibrioformis]